MQPGLEHGNSHVLFVSPQAYLQCSGNEIEVRCDVSCAEEEDLKGEI
jgi:hypothetical protein